jgi:Domain of unknown function (DUF4214)
MTQTEAIHWGYGGDDLTVTGSAGASFENDGTSTVGDSAVIDVPVTGTGSFLFSPWAESPTFSLEFGQPVSAGQTVSMVREGWNKLTLDDPQAFAGTVVLVSSASSEIDLKGLPGASGYTYSAGLLTIYAGGTAIDALRLTSSAAIQVEAASPSDVYVLEASNTSLLGSVLADPPSQFVAPPTSASDGSPEAEVYRLCQAAFDRAPDPGGDVAWINGLEHGLSPLQMASDFVASSEFQADYAGLSIPDFVTELYHNVLGRVPDPAGAAGWENALAAGVSKAQIVLDFADSQENRMNVAAHAS